jgi:type I restriction enzyme R subunit
VRERHQQGLLLSVEFLKELLNLARDVVTAEQTLPPIDEEQRGSAAC